MADPQIPPARFSPLNSRPLSLSQRVAAWFELMETSEQFLLGGIRHRIGPEGDLPHAVRRWYRQEMEQHDQTMIGLLEQLGRRERDCRHAQ